MIVILFSLARWNRWKFIENIDKVAFDDECIWPNYKFKTNRATLWRNFFVQRRFICAFLFMSAFFFFSSFSLPL